MHYLGGKSRQGKYIADIIKNEWLTGKYTYYIEPFCGALWSAIAVAKSCPSISMLLSDNNLHLINMWKHAFNGHNFPDVVSLDYYNKLKRLNDPSDPNTAFVGFGCAFAGRYFSNYARDKMGSKDEDTFPKRAKQSINKKIEILNSISHTIDCCDYTIYEGVKNCIFYLDPPYANGHTPNNSKFDHEKFWHFARKLSVDNFVIVTEFHAPSDFESIFSFGNTIVKYLGNDVKTDKTDEQIFKYKGE